MLGKKAQPNHTRIKKLLRTSFILSQNSKYLHTKCMCKHELVLRLNCTGTIFLVGSFVRSVVFFSSSYRFDFIQSGSVGILYSQFYIGNASGIFPGLVFFNAFIYRIFYLNLFLGLRDFIVSHAQKLQTHASMYAIGISKISLKISHRDEWICSRNFIAALNLLSEVYRYLIRFHFYSPFELFSAIFQGFAKRQIFVLFILFFHPLKSITAIPNEKHIAEQIFAK